MQASWHAAAFFRAKKLPPLDRVLEKIGPKERRPASPRRHLAQLEGLVALLGGTPLKRKPKLKPAYLAATKEEV